MNNALKAVGFVLLLSATPICNAQTQDFLSWTSLELGYEPNKKWELELEGQFRLKDDFSTIDEYFGQFQINRTLIKGLKLGAAARYTRENDNRGRIQGYENHFRYHFDLRYRHKADDFTLKYRLRYQNKTELGVDNNEARRFVRFKAAVAYNIKGWKLDPEFAAEYFNRIQAEEGRPNRYRLTLGTDYKIKNGGRIGAFIRLQDDLSDVDRETFYILGLKYAYTIK